MKVGAHPAVCGFCHITHGNGITPGKYEHYTNVQGTQTPKDARGAPVWGGFRQDDIATLTLDTSGQAGSLTMVVPRPGIDDIYKLDGIDVTREWRLLLMFGPHADVSFRVMKA